jgi:hypothetical protein
MKKLVIGLIAMLLSIELYAQEKISKPEANSIVYFGGSYTRSHIKPSGLSDFDGNMGGMQGMYQYRPLRSVYAAIDMFLRSGKNSGKDGTRDLIDAGTHERIGYTFALKDDQVLLTSYTGFGYRHLDHYIKPNSGSKIKLRYNELFIPVGLQSIYDMHQWFSIGFNAVWMPQVFSTVTFNVVDGARWVIKNTYKNFKIALPFYFHIDRVTNLSVVLNPFFEIWQDGRSIAKTQFNDSLDLPKNTYTFWGLELNLQYAF